MTRYIFLLCFLLYLSRAQAQTWTFEIPGDWNDNPGLSVADDASLILKSGHLIASTVIFKIDPAKTSKLTGSFKKHSGKGKVKVTFALRIYDKDKREVTANSVMPVLGTDTILVTPAKSEDTAIIVKEGKGFTRGALAVNTRPDYSDLPNFNLLAGIKKTELREDDTYLVTLSGPLGRALSAGTNVRAHYGYLNQNSGGVFEVGNEWIQREGIIKGLAKSGYGGEQWRPGAAYAQILISIDGKDSSIQFKNVKFETVKD